MVSEAAVSRAHCEIAYTPSPVSPSVPRYCLRDLGSTTGTFLFVKPNLPFALFAGLMLKMGETEFVVGSSSTPAPSRGGLFGGGASASTSVDGCGAGGTERRAAPIPGPFGTVQERGSSTSDLEGGNGPKSEKPVWGSSAPPASPHGARTPPCCCANADLLLYFFEGPAAGKSVALSPNRGLVLGRNSQFECGGGPSNAGVVEELLSELAKDHTLSAKQLRIWRGTPRGGGSF